MPSPLEKLLPLFAIDGELAALEEHKRGHINTTWIGSWRTSSGPVRYVHQRVNHNVFCDVPGLMRNMARVTGHIRRLKDSGRCNDITLTIVPTRCGQSVIQDEVGDFWRTFEFIENTMSFDVCPSPAVAREAAAILGRFQSQLFDLNPAELIETIPEFHNAPKRFDALNVAAEKDIAGRRQNCRDEIAFGLAARDVAGLLVGALREGTSKLRVTHNDMKLNNVLFDASGTRAVALVDLDTCMPGSVLFDFGDFARNTSVPAAEDETDHALIQVDTELFSAIMTGYLESVGDTLTDRELDLLPVSPQVLALTLGVRFLTDYLQGDTYFKVHHERQNLDRARAQFVVAERFRAAEPKLRRVMGSDSAQSS